MHEKRASPATHCMLTRRPETIPGTIARQPPLSTENLRDLNGPGLSHTHHKPAKHRSAFPSWPWRVTNPQLRVVLKSALPARITRLDVLGHRLPNLFIQHSKVGESLFIEPIKRLAAGLGPAGALVIFPEGVN